MTIKEWILTRYILRAISHQLRYLLNYFVLNSKVFFKNSVIYPGVKIFSTKNIKIGKYVVIKENTYLYVFKNGFIDIGEDVFIGMFCVIDGTGGVTIGNKVAISYHTSIISASHEYTDTEIPPGEQGTIAKGIKIEDNVWIGANVTILDGVSIGEGAIIGAGSVVTHDIPKFAVAVGVPATVIRYRKKVD
jgi:acetyltransferase-like isoleucine patch superfamily enzyme